MNLALEAEHPAEFKRMNGYWTLPVLLILVVVSTFSRMFTSQL